MNLFYFLFMEAYKEYLYSFIGYVNDNTLESVERRIKGDTKYTINRNEEGKIHSRYLGDRYEPAIIRKEADLVFHYYLFDGDIKDCIHPFRIGYQDGIITSLMYYSSERIINREPNIIRLDITCYNYCCEKKILDGYESKCIPEIKIIEDVTLCDEMDMFPFKFAD